MKKHLLIACLGLLLLIAPAVLADFCAKCADMGFTADIGKCTKCGEEKTTSGSHKLCPNCSQKIGQCEHCAATLPKAPPASQPATEPTE